VTFNDTTRDFFAARDGPPAPEQRRAITAC
jgi:hypothetical protein